MTGLLRAALVAALTILLAAVAAAATFPAHIDLPDNYQPEGIASGKGKQLFVGSIPTGEVRRIDARTGEQDVVVEGAADRRAIVVIVSEIARGGLNQAVLAIEETRGRIDAALATEFPDNNRYWRSELYRLRDDLVGDLQQPLRVFLWSVALVLLLSVPSPLLVAAYTALERQQVLSNAELAAADWMARETPERSVFATDGWLNSPTDAAGRLRLLTFTPYVANLGFDPDERVRQVYVIYCGDPGQTVPQLDELGASYILEARRPADCLVPVDFATVPGLELAYDRDGIRIWHRTAVAPGNG